MSSSTRASSLSVNGWNAEYLDDQYARYRTDPASVPPDVRAFFAGFDLAGVQFAARGGIGAGAAGGASPPARAAERLIEAYRRLGHVSAQTDPFGRVASKPAELTLAYHGLSDADLGQSVNGKTLGELVSSLEAWYCGSIGVEFQHCETTAEREWFAGEFERAAEPANPSDQRRTLEHLTQSETLESFFSKRYPGKKRFSLEGAETLIPMLKFLTEHAGLRGTREVIAAMAHRGRVNVLWSYVGKETTRLMTEFEDSWVEGHDLAGGDVKYHRGYSGDQALPDGRLVHISMLNNPSHLESVNAVAIGRTRAKQDSLGGGAAGQDAVMCLLIHGDGAVIGQGVVAEALNMASLDGYTVGGTVHVVINNLVAFTTDPRDGRSTAYCTDIAKMANAPVLHVNADDPDACVRAARLAVEYRARFRKDVFIDLVCYRKWGHNESDEPRYTQPDLYEKVSKHPGTRAIYAAFLERAGVTQPGEADAMVKGVFARLDEAQTEVKVRPVRPVSEPGGGSWAGFVGEYSFASPETAISRATLEEVCAALGRVPEGFAAHPKLRGLLEARGKLALSKKLSHADAEMLAFGTLVLQGVPVRVSGQDSRRGTFTQRHAVFRDIERGTLYTPINHIRKDQTARAEFWDSPLSEYSVMGFDYGYSRGSPRTLVCWEAQFGDFCNTAQVIIDQYLASSEIKWERWGGLVLLLPHGYEGQGPEHSSARLERFLLLAADRNMEIVNPSTGSQMFHLLRRQALRNFRKPLVVMTPKKLLRAELASTDELTSGTFQHLIDDAQADPKGVTRVIYCSGKIFHDLSDRRASASRRDVAIVRVEQLYPFHAELARAIDGRYPRSAERAWVQEEPRNAGAFLHIADVFRQELGVELSYIGRKASATPAAGSEKIHAKQQEQILSQAIEGKAARLAG